MSHHKLGTDYALESSKPLVFVMDPMKEVVKEEPDKKIKTKEPPLTNKNFGAKLDLGKVKSCTMLELAWRMRQGLLHFVGFWC